MDSCSFYQGAPAHIFSVRNKIRKHCDKEILRIDDSVYLTSTSNFSYSQNAIASSHSINSVINLTDISDASSRTSSMMSGVDNENLFHRGKCHSSLPILRLETDRTLVRCQNELTKESHSDEEKRNYLHYFFPFKVTKCLQKKVTAFNERNFKNNINSANKYVFRFLKSLFR